jgi:hypothetical protein
MADISAITASANKTVNDSNELIGQSEFLISNANRTLGLNANPNADIRLGGNGIDPTQVSVEKSSLQTQKLALLRQINKNKTLIEIYGDETKKAASDPAVISARQQIQTSTLQLQTSLAKLGDTLAIIEGAGPQIAATAAPEITTQDTAQRDIENTTSPAVVAGGTSNLPENQLRNLTTNSGSNTGLGQVPNVSDKVEPALESARGIIKLTTSPIDVTAPRIYPDQVNINEVLPNVLHSYASYTYGLSLALLTEIEYNLIQEKGEYKPNRVLIASAGRYNNIPGPTQFIRSPYFKEDFYFDGFKLDTVVGLNAESRSTNAIKYDFTLIEPYGFTLIDRIINLANSLEVSNYLDMPYLLQIDFFGMDDSGQITGVIPDTTKRIPIRILKLDVKITNRGAEYAIMGTPYNHSAFDLTTLSVPTIVEVEAKTVAQFFQSDVVQGDTTNTTGQREKGITTPDGVFQPLSNINQSLLSTQTRRQLGLFATSFGTALNNHQKSLVIDGKIEYADKYFFNIDPDIALKKFVEGSFSTPKNAGMVIINSGSGLTKDNNTRKGDIGSDHSSYTLDSRLFTINPGTYIDQVISWVIRNSEYVTEQIVIPEDFVDKQDYIDKLAEKKNSPLKWFKVVPEIKLGPFDRIRKIFSREITYNIQKYEVRNLKIPLGPGGIAGRQKPPVKSYEYIYSGKNNDIIDLDIKFNALYYTALTTYRSSAAKLAQPPDPRIAEQDENPKGVQIGSVQDPNAIMPMVMKSQVADTRSTTGSGAITPIQIAVSDLEASLLTLSQADMLHVHLKIIGDPSFIKQDDIFWTPRELAEFKEHLVNADPRLTPDGSLKMDGGEVYVNLTFRTPVDIDEDSGMMQFKDKDILGPTQTSLFSGLYRVMRVENEFRNGQFTQMLNLIRLPLQETPKSGERGNAVPGQRAILDNYNLGPDFGTSNSDIANTANSTTLEAEGAAQPAQSQVGPDNADPSLRTKEEQELAETRALAAEEPISVTTEPQSVPPGPAETTSPPVRLPDGVTQDPASGNYKYKGLVIPAEPGTDQFNRAVTAVDNKQTIQITQIDNVSGNPITRTFDGNYTQAAVERAQNNVTFAERELARLENKVRTDPEFQNLNSEQQTNLDIARARRIAEVSAAKSDLAQAKAGK